MMMGVNTRYQSQVGQSLNNSLIIKSLYPQTAVCTVLVEILEFYNFYLLLICFTISLDQGLKSFSIGSGSKSWPKNM